eukprot:3588301-Prymnesium_polylepis.1
MLTLGRDARSRPNPLPTTASTGETQPITKVAQSKLGYATQGRMSVYDAWPQALSAAECTDAHVG